MDKNLSCEFLDKELSYKVVGNLNLSVDNYPSLFVDNLNFELVDNNLSLNLWTTM